MSISDRDRKIEEYNIPKVYTERKHLFLDHQHSVSGIIKQCQSFLEENQIDDATASLSCHGDGEFDGGFAYIQRQKTDEQLDKDIAKYEQIKNATKEKENKAANFIIGKVMKQIPGADPKLVRQILEIKIEAMKEL